MTRIVAGAARGRRLQVPDGDRTRPTSDRVREALFSSLESTFGTLSGVSFLDVFAGTGAVGLEAASRGASCVTFVERDSSVAALISSNARTLGLGNIDVVTAAASTWLRTSPVRLFDVAFLDPPYDVSAESLTPVVTALGARGRLAPGAVVVIERSRRSGPWEWPGGFEAARFRRYGDTVLWYGRFEPPREESSAAAPSEPYEEEV